MASTPMTTNELAERCGTDVKTLRRFLRSQLSPTTMVGKGHRYSLTRGEARQVQRAFLRHQREQGRIAAA